MELELTILMPCLNEARTLSACIQKAKQFLANEKIQGEILVADNGSTDQSQRIACELGARVIRVATRGYGAALKTGMREARGKFIIMGDADDSYDFLNLTPFLQKLREGYDFVMGNRFKGGIEAGAMPFLNRYLGNPILSRLGRLFYKSPIGDFHCGLRGFNRQAILKLDLQRDGMEFASEMVVKATLQKMKTTEVPIKLYPDGRNRRPHLRPWRDGWQHLRLLLLFSPRWLFFYPSLFFLLLGMGSMGLLLTGPVVIGRINLDIHTMLFSSLFMIVGFEILCFATFATVIANFQLKIHSVYTHPLSMLNWLTLERGLLLGLGLVGMGIIGAGYTLWYWVHHAFGPLVPTQMMRILIPSMTSMILGIQLMSASFFMSLLNLHYAHDFVLRDK